MSEARRLTGFLSAALALMLATPVLDAQRGQQRSPDVAGNRGRAAQSPGITAQQLETTHARIEIARGIVARLQSQAKALGRAGSWNQSTLEMLLALPLSALQRVERDAFTVDALPALVAEASEDPQLIGDPNQDLLYFPITPCRFADTRGVGGRIDGFRAYDLAFTGATYGGDGACNLPSLFGVPQNQFGALAMNVTLVDPTAAPGFVAAKPTAASPTTSLLNWYDVGPTVQAANQGIVTMDQSGAGPEFVIQTSAPVHIVLDVFGAFLAPHATPLDIVSVTTPWSSLGGPFSVVATCPAGYSVTGGGFFRNPGTPGAVDATQASRDGNGFRCGGVTAGSESGYCEAICGRVPGR